MQRLEPQKIKLSPVPQAENMDDIDTMIADAFRSLWQAAGLDAARSMLASAPQESREGWAQIVRLFEKRYQHGNEAADENAETISARRRCRARPPEKK